MRFSITERLILLQLLPNQGNMITVKLCQDLKAKLELSESEMKRADVKMVDDQLTWKPDDGEKKIELFKAETELIVTQLKELDNQEKLTEHHIGVWDKFMGLTGKTG
jgi:hypothetical protein